MEFAKPGTCTSVATPIESCCLTGTSTSSSSYSSPSYPSSSSSSSYGSSWDRELRQTRFRTFSRTGKIGASEGLGRHSQRPRPRRTTVTNWTLGLSTLLLAAPSSDPPLPFSWRTADDRSACSPASLLAAAAAAEDPESVPRPESDSGSGAGADWFSNSDLGAGEGREPGTGFFPVSDQGAGGDSAWFSNSDLGFADVATAPRGFSAEKSWPAKDRAKLSSKGSSKADEMRTLLMPSGHNDPRPKDYEPREHSNTDPWAFGKAHAVLNHILSNSPEGDPLAAVKAFDSFSEMHGLPFGVLDAHANIMNMALEEAMHNLFPEVNTSREFGSHDDSGNLRGNQAGEGKSDSESNDADDDDLLGFPGMNVLVMGAGLGGRTLHLLPQLQRLSSNHPSSPVHEVVSLEHDPFLSAQSMQLLQHVIGSSFDGDFDDDGDDGSGEVKQKKKNKPLPIRHLPFMPGEDTSLQETVESLRDSYELPVFHTVLLSSQDEGPWGDAPDQLQTLFSLGALAPGAVIHAEFSPGRSGVQSKMEALVQQLSQQDAPDNNNSNNNNNNNNNDNNPKKPDKNSNEDASVRSPADNRPRLTAKFHDLGNGHTAMVASVRRKHDEL